MSEGNKKLIYLRNFVLITEISFLMLWSTCMHSESSGNATLLPLKCASDIHVYHYLPWILYWLGVALQMTQKERFDYMLNKHRKCKLNVVTLRLYTVPKEMQHLIKLFVSMGFRWYSFCSSVFINITTDKEIFSFLIVPYQILQKYVLQLQPLC